MPKYILDYTKKLHERVVHSKDLIIGEYRDQNNQKDYLISSLKDKLEMQEK